VGSIRQGGISAVREKPAGTAKGFLQERKPFFASRGKLLFTNAVCFVIICLNPAQKPQSRKKTLNF
jgi:hypothetical protein